MANLVSAAFGASSGAAPPFLSCALVLGALRGHCTFRHLRAKEHVVLIEFVPLPFVLTGKKNVFLKPQQVCFR